LNKTRESSGKRVRLFCSISRASRSLLAWFDLVNNVTSSRGTGKEAKEKIGTLSRVKPEQQQMQ
jgi:hypothetical protein